MSFESYKGGTELGSGLTPSGGANFALMQSCDIQVEEATENFPNGKRLHTLLAELADAVEGVDLSSEITEQINLVDRIKAALEAKANDNAGGSCSCPEPTIDDEGKFLSVVGGRAKYVVLPIAEDIVIKPAEDITFNE